MERGICPIATLYSIAAAYKGVLQTGRNYLYGTAGEKFK